MNCDSENIILFDNYFSDSFKLKIANKNNYLIIIYRKLNFKILNIVNKHVILDDFLIDKKIIKFYYQIIILS